MPHTPQKRVSVHSCITQNGQLDHNDVIIMMTTYLFIWAKTDGSNFSFLVAAFWSKFNCLSSWINESLCAKNYSCWYLHWRPASFYQSPPIFHRHWLWHHNLSVSDVLHVALPAIKYKKYHLTIIRGIRDVVQKLLTSFLFCIIKSKSDIPCLEITRIL